MENSNIPPVAKKVDKEITAHNHTRTDPYYWLNERENPEVISYLKAENEYTRNCLQYTEVLQNILFKEITGRIIEDESTVPFQQNGYLYYDRFEKGMEYPLICRKKAGSDDEEILLDGNKLAKGHSFFDIGDWKVSTNNNLIAYSIDTVSRRKYTIFVKDLASGKSMDDKIGNTNGKITWANDNRTFYYTIKDKTLRSFKIFRHYLGNEKSADILVFHEQDPVFTTGIFKSKSEEFLVIKSESTLSTECRILEANNPEGEFRIFQERQKDLLYSIFYHHNRFYILTNLNAKNFRLMKTYAGQTQMDSWEEVIPHNNESLLKEIELFEKHIVIHEKKMGLDQIRVMEIDGTDGQYVKFDEPVYSLELNDNFDINLNFVRIEYSSLTTPNTIVDIDLFSKKRTIQKQDRVLGDFNPENYKSERIYAIAEDGVKIPISLVYKKGILKKGTNPLWIKAYGSYGYDSDPSFRSRRLSLLDRGFIFAIAHVRGGQEMGRQWYEDGKLLKKKNTFTDFIACTEFLIRNGYTNSNKVFAWGGSAGGLLIGAVMNLRPDLYKGMIAAVPFVDVITTMLDESIPLTTGEYDEWGNPENKEYYDYMLSYSPYDNVEGKDYPALLVTTGLHDSQVQYWEPAKWVAKLRDMKTDNNPLFLLIQMDYGHGGASGRFERYKEVALEYAFVLDLMGIKI
ncbi:MAG: S9 family peptidase [Bacteroidales bacterium]|nr:S9 family peptidase [Bacteroidales bacterium]